MITLHADPFCRWQKANYQYRFVHERGYRTAIFNLGVLGGINLATPIGVLLGVCSQNGAA